MARVAAFEYETLPPALQQLADAYQARGASWDHLRVLAHRPEMYEGPPLKGGDTAQPISGSSLLPWLTLGQ